MRPIRPILLLATLLAVLVGPAGCSPWAIRVPPAPQSLPAAEAAQRIRIVAHRCGGAEAPENTLAAAGHCLEQGVAWIEVDVRSSRDGVLVALHDESLERTTDCRGLVRHWTADDLAACDAGSRFSDEYAGEPIPRLEEILLWAKGRIGVYLDLKSADPDAVAELVRRTGMTRHCFFGFDGWEQAAAFAARHPDLALKQLVCSVEEIDRAADELGATIVEIRPKHLSPEMVQACRDRNLQWMIPIFGRHDEAYRAALDWGPDLINLDCPERFRRLAESR